MLCSIRGEWDRARIVGYPSVTLRSPPATTAAPPIAAKPSCANFRLIFAYNIQVWNLPQSRLCDFAVRCKGCGETIPAPVGNMPDFWIVVACSLCGERRRHFPADIFRGKLSHLLTVRREHVRP